MANTNLTADIILKEAKRVFKNSCPFITSLGRNYDGVISAEGAKAGESIRIRRPMKYSVRSGKTMDVQNNTETYETLTRSNWYGVDLCFSQKELTMDINRFSELYVKPAMSVLASKVEHTCMLQAAKETYNAVTLPVTSLDRDDIIAARKMLNNYSAPQNDRFGVLNPEGEGDLCSANAALFTPSTSIDRQYTEGVLGRIYGFDVASSANVPSITNISDVAAAIDTDGAQTGAALTVDVFATPVAGMIIQSIGDDVFGLNPVTQESLGILQTFVLRDTTTQSATNLDIAPSVTVTGNQKTVSATPDNDDVVTFMGSASTAYPRNLFYQKMAYAVSFVDLELPSGLDFAATNTEDGMAMTIMRDFDIKNADTNCRIDVVFGFKTIIPEWAVQVFGV